MMMQVRIPTPPDSRLKANQKMLNLQKISVTRTKMQTLRIVQSISFRSRLLTTTQKLMRTRLVAALWLQIFLKRRAQSFHEEFQDCQELCLVRSPTMLPGDIWKCHALQHSRMHSQKMTAFDLWCKMASVQFVPMQDVCLSLLLTFQMKMQSIMALLPTSHLSSLPM